MTVEMAFLMFSLFTLVMFVYRNLDEAKLKEKGRAFHDSFLTKVLFSYSIYFKKFPNINTTKTLIIDKQDHPTHCLLIYFYV